jgi:hypothetical protein
MTEAHPAHSTRRASRDHEGATPSIAIMALLTGLAGSPIEALFVRARCAAGWNGHHVPAHDRVPFAATGLRLQIS